MEVKHRYLKYDFAYKGIGHRGRIKLDESVPNVHMLYDDHDMEVTWFKRIQHKEEFIEINIVVKDDWNNCKTLGNVAASAWVCVYDKTGKHVVEDFEPNYWEYIDKENAANNINKKTFYMTKHGV